RDLAAAWQHFAGEPECGLGELVITQHPILIITQSQQGLGRVRLKFLRIFQSFSCCIATSGSCVSTAEVKKSIRTSKPRPSRREIRVKLHRLLIRTDGFP